MRAGPLDAAFASRQTGGRAGFDPARRIAATSCRSHPDPTLPAARLVSPAAARRGTAITRPGAPAPLDVVHDHLLRVVGERDVAHRLLLDVLARAGARARDLGEAPTLTVLLRHARARLTPLVGDHLEGDHLAALAPADPEARALARALAVPAERAAALLDLTARHGLDTRTAAELLGIAPWRAAGVRAAALHQVRATLATGEGERLDVEAALAALPVVPAPAELHGRLGTVPRRLPPAAAWLSPAVALAAVAASVLLGLPRVVVEAVDGDVPLVTAEGVVEGPVVRQLGSDASGLPQLLPGR